MKNSLFIGRFQPLHSGHIKIIRKVLDEGNHVVIGLRDTQKDDKNPYSIVERTKMFEREFAKEVGKTLTIITLPDINQVCYGRDVGYDIRRVESDPYTESVSATKVRSSKVWWFTGNSGAGKTTLAVRVQDAIKLDGDALRNVWKLGFSKEDRYEQNLRTARLAKLLSEQGYDVVVSTICPYKDLRDQVQEICNCKFVYIEGGKEPSEKYPYEK